MIRFGTLLEETYGEPHSMVSIARLTIGARKKISEQLML